MNKPILYLVGAGPGDPELITVKAVRILQSAGVVLYDALANEALLKYCPNYCIKRCVGKRFGEPALLQEAINRLIVEYAFTHKRLVRLKGGDPFVFGRAQEEMEIARNAGITVEVVPGISSAMAVPASKMIPLTSRGISDGFWVTTGMTESGAIPGDLRHAAASTTTVVVLMGMGRLKEIMDIFSTYRHGNTPVAVIQNGTLPNEKMVIGDIENIYSRVESEGLKNPAVIVVGEVVRLQTLSMHKFLRHELKQ